jgi:hypothetical protein
VIFGVDKNPMAVELAKVALWLHTFTVGAPLSFLDHHLRAGDSLLGGWAGDLRASLKERGELLTRGLVARVEHAARAVEEVGGRDRQRHRRGGAQQAELGRGAGGDGAAGGVHVAGAGGAADGRLASAPARRPKPIEQLRGAKSSTIERAERDWAALNRAEAWQEVLDGGFGDPFAIAAGMAEIGEAAAEGQFSLLEAAPDTQQALLQVRLPDNRRRAIARELVGQARRLAAGHGFLHWQVAFPTVWRRWLEGLPEGGFDVVIGNPPYVRQERLGEIKPALKAGYAAYDGVADLYVYFYELG